MNQIINSLYEHFKNTEKKLKIVCDWDEVIQAHEPYALWEAILKEREYPPLVEFSKYFKKFWEKEYIKYSPYGSSLEQGGKVYIGSMGGGEKELEFKSKVFMERQQEIKNSPNFYQQAPFLTIAEDLLKLIKEDKVEQLIFLSAYDKRKFPDGDKRKYEIFTKTFAKFGEKINFNDDVIVDKGNNIVPNLVKDMRLRLIGFDSEKKGQSKADWIKENASDFDIVIDDNPIICGSLVRELCPHVLKQKLPVKNFSCNDCVLGFKETKITVLSPYYPAVENQHDEKVLLVKNEVSGLKKGGFNSKI